MKIIFKYLELFLELWKIKVNRDNENTQHACTQVSWRGLPEQHWKKFAKILRPLEDTTGQAIGSRADPKMGKWKDI